MLLIVDKPVIHKWKKWWPPALLKLFFTEKGKQAIEDHFDNAVLLEVFLEPRGKPKLATDAEWKLSTERYLLDYCIAV